MAHAFVLAASPFLPTSDESESGFKGRGTTARCVPRARHLTPYRTNMSVKQDARLIRQESGTAIRFLSSKCPIDVIAKIRGYPLLGA